MAYLYCILTLLLSGSIAQAKIFQNTYMSFEVPDNWSCAQDGVAWFCAPNAKHEAKDALVVLTAKAAGPTDTLDAFFNYLKTPKKTRSRAGTPVPSQVVYAQKRQLGGLNWIQAQHLGSEIPDFYTLYLATLNDKLVIMASFSAQKNRFKAYEPIFEHSIKTIKIVANQQALFPPISNIVQPIPVAGPFKGEKPNPIVILPTKALPLKTQLFNSPIVRVGLVVFVLAIVAYFLTLRRKKNSHRKSRKSKSK